MMASGDYNGIDGSDMRMSFSDHDPDACKAFITRIPSTFDEDSVARILRETFGDESIVEVSLVCEREEEGEDLEGVQDAAEHKEVEDEKTGDASEKVIKKSHRGFGFVIFSSTSKQKEAIDAGTVRGSAKFKSKKRHTLYIRPIVREEEGGNSMDECNATAPSSKNECYLWSKYRCPYGDSCRFAHVGDGGCVEKAEEGGKRKRQKCFAFKKRGKCKLGDECPFVHEAGGCETSRKGTAEAKESSSNKSEKDCINWKTKGKCRKGNRCPYRHDESVRSAAIAKREAKKRDREEGGKEDGTTSAKKNKKEKNRQPLSVRVFGLNYDTTEKDVRSYFEHCGPIVELTFPTWEDSGRSKGYCGLLFQSPKAVAKAVELNGKELHGRWLSVQAGKMYLRQWEESEGKMDKPGSDATKKESEEPHLIGEFGQKVKRRKKHGYQE